MWTVDFAIKLLSVIIAAVAFSILFSVRPKHLLIDAIGATATIIIYTFIEFRGLSLFAAAFVSTVVAAIYSEVCARIGRAPTIVFLVPCLLPTIPGGALYRSMSAFLGRNYEAGLDYLMTTFKISIGIAGGIVTVSILVKIVMGFLDMIRSRGVVAVEVEKVDEEENSEI